MKRIKKSVWLFVIIPAAVGVVMLFIGMITQNIKTGLWVGLVYLMVSELIMLPLNIAITAIRRNGNCLGSLALAGLITWVEYYVIRNLIHLASVWLMKGV